MIGDGWMEAVDPLEGGFGISLWVDGSFFRVFGVWLSFRSEKCANNIFLFFKNYFWDLHIKMIWKHQKHIILKQKKN